MDLDLELEQAIAEAPIEEGVCFLFCPHTTAGIVLNYATSIAERYNEDVLISRLSRLEGKATATAAAGSRSISSASSKRRPADRASSLETAYILPPDAASAS